MTRDLIASFGAAVFLTIATVGLTSEVSAQEFSGSGLPADEDTFEVGGSCAALAYLSSSQLKAYINAGYSDDFHSFCYPEEPSECADYSAFLKGLGRLTTGEDGYHCSLLLQP